MIQTNNHDDNVDHDVDHEIKYLISIECNTHG